MARARRRTTLFVLFIFGSAIIAILARGVVFERSHDEGDEVLYRALMEQMHHGRGYTLHGNAVLASSRFSRDIYDKPVFPQHPPGGVLLFLASDLATPGYGASTAQVLSFALFFAGMLLMWRAVAVERDWLGECIVAVACIVPPIAAHVTTRQWFDGPLLGFATLASGLYLLGIRRRRWIWVTVGAVLFYWSAWTKLTALGILPWLVLLSAVIDEDDGHRFARRGALLLVAASLAAFIPWELWLISHGMAMGAASRPSIDLLAHNRYVRFVTLERSPLVYFTATPFVIWTIIPSFLMTWQQRAKDRPTRIHLALWIWILGTLLTYSVLGAAGYSKLLRYAILVTPATILLFASLTRGLLARLPTMSAANRFLWLGLASGGLGMEMVQGVYLTVQTRLDMIVSVAVPALSWIARHTHG